MSFRIGATPRGADDDRGEDGRRRRRRASLLPADSSPFDRDGFSLGHRRVVVVVSGPREEGRGRPEEGARFLAVFLLGSPDGIGGTIHGRNSRHALRAGGRRAERSPFARGCMSTTAAQSVPGNSGPRHTRRSTIRPPASAGSDDPRNLRRPGGGRRILCLGSDEARRDGCDRCCSGRRRGSPRGRRHRRGERRR